MQTDFYIRSYIILADTHHTSWKHAVGMGRLSSKENCKQEFGSEWEQMEYEIHDKGTTVLNPRRKEIEKQFAYQQSQRPFSEEEKISLLIYAACHRNTSLFKDVLTQHNFQEKYQDYYFELLRHSTLEPPPYEEGSFNGTEISEYLIQYFSLSNLQKFINQTKVNKNLEYDNSVLKYLVRKHHEQEREELNKGLIVNKKRIHSLL